MLFAEDGGAATDENAPASRSYWEKVLTNAETWVVREFKFVSSRANLSSASGIWPRMADSDPKIRAPVAQRNEGVGELHGNGVGLHKTESMSLILLQSFIYRSSSRTYARARLMARPVRHSFERVSVLTGALLTCPPGPSF